MKPGTSVPGGSSCVPEPRPEGALAAPAMQDASAPSGRVLLVEACSPWAEAQGFMPALLRNAEIGPKTPSQQDSTLLTGC